MPTIRARIKYKNKRIPKVAQKWLSTLLEDIGTTIIERSNLENDRKTSSFLQNAHFLALNDALVLEITPRTKETPLRLVALSKSTE